MTRRGALVDAILERAENVLGRWASQKSPLPCMQYCKYVYNYKDFRSICKKSDCYDSKKSSSKSEGVPHQNSRKVLRLVDAVDVMMCEDSEDR